jgi:hypothetical protein
VASADETRLVRRAAVTSIESNFADGTDKKIDSIGKPGTCMLTGSAVLKRPTKTSSQVTHIARAVRKANDGGPMSVKPELAFDVCWEVYKGAKEVLEAKRGISALKFEEATKFAWRPDNRPRLNEWVADFALAGKAALEGPEWASRMVLFRVYYLGLAPYDKARHFVGLSERSWVNWTEEIRRHCGQELLRRGMFPPRKYFTLAA